MLPGPEPELSIQNTHPKANRGMKKKPDGETQNGSEGSRQQAHEGGIQDVKSSNKTRNVMMERPNGLCGCNHLMQSTTVLTVQNEYPLLSPNGPKSRE